MRRVNGTMRITARNLALAGAAVFCCLALSDLAHANQSVKLDVKFTPNHPNASTTIHFSFAVGAPHNAVPVPVTGLALELPVGMGLGLMTLGEAVCKQHVLEVRGPNGCSPNAVMGVGNAVIELPVESQMVHTEAALKVFMGTPMHDHTVMLFDAVSVTPVSGEVLFPGELVPVHGGLGASLETLIPNIPTWPGGADATVTKMESTLGPEHLTYYRHVHGKRVGYRPIGMTVPAVCPHKGYRFSIRVGFADGTSASATSRVPCHG